MDQRPRDTGAATPRPTMRPFVALSVALGGAGAYAMDAHRWDCDLIGAQSWLGAQPRLHFLVCMVVLRAGGRGRPPFEPAVKKLALLRIVPFLIMAWGVWAVLQVLGSRTPLVLLRHRSVAAWGALTLVALLLVFSSRQRYPHLIRSAGPPRPTR
jgi:hypothetical protein